MAGLDASQIRAYNERGYLVLDEFVAPAACARLRHRAAELVDGFDPGPVASIFSTRGASRTTDEYFLASGDDVRFFFEEDAFDADGVLVRPKARSINKIGHALHDLDPVFGPFSRSPELERLAGDLGYADPLLVQSMYIFKQPGIGGEVTCHQDATFLYTDPPTTIGLWFALENATLENGCLWVAPGGHRAGLRARFVRDASGGAHFETCDPSPWPVDALVPLVVSEGALIVLHGMLPHLSRANRSSRSRQAYTLHLIERSSRYAVENWLQRDAANPFRGF